MADGDEEDEEVEEVGVAVAHWDVETVLAKKVSLGSVFTPASVQPTPPTLPALPL